MAVRSGCWRWRSPPAHNKAVNGRKRHLLVDTLGLILVAIVHAANQADVTAARMLVSDASLNQPTLKHISADQGYQSKRLQKIARDSGITLEVVRRQGPKFEVQPRRWVVERTFAWLGKQRRLSKDYERLPAVSEAVVYAAMIPLMLERLLA